MTLEYKAPLIVPRSSRNLHIKGSDFGFTNGFINKIENFKKRFAEIIVSVANIAADGEYGEDDKKAIGSRVGVLVYNTYRSPCEQARLYRQSRERLLIEGRYDELMEDGFPNLAEILKSVGPQYGKMNQGHVTNAASGQSWHNYCAAVDAVPMIKTDVYNSRMSCLWRTEPTEDVVFDTGFYRFTIREIWKTFEQAVTEAGLSWGGNWTGNLNDVFHVQDFDCNNYLLEEKMKKLDDLIGRGRLVESKIS